jgi:hypothetical protein
MNAKVTIWMKDWISELERIEGKSLLLVGVGMSFSAGGDSFEGNRIRKRVGT